MSNRHTNIKCPECFKIYRDDYIKTHFNAKHSGKILEPATLHELREEARSGSILGAANEEKDKKDEKKEKKKSNEQVMHSLQALTDQINQENASLRQELAEIKNAIINPKKRKFPETEKEEEKKLTKSQQDRYDQYIGVFRNNVAAATFLATRNIEESTRVRYCAFLKSFFKLEDTISQEAVNDFFTLHRNKSELSPETLNGIKKVLKAVCANTPSLNNVVFGKQKEKTKKKKKEDIPIPTKAEVENLIHVLESGDVAKTLGVFLEVMFVTALRPVDVVFLKASELCKKKDDFYINVTEKKTHKLKLTMITERLYKRLIELATAPEDRLFSFIPENGYRKSLSRLFNKHCKINGVAILPKSIRQASITHAYKGGLEAAALQGSHSNPAITIKHYIDPKETDKQRWLSEAKKEEKKDENQISAFTRWEKMNEEKKIAPQKKVIYAGNHPNLKKVNYPEELIQSFIDKAKLNTENRVETTGLLFGVEDNGAYFITHILIPEQIGSSDTCAALNYEQMATYAREHCLISLGWIHTHPSYASFLSSVDLHTQQAYQKLLPESIAVVYSGLPSPKKAKLKIFRIKDEHMDEIEQCKGENFHKHSVDDALLYEECAHIANYSPLAKGMKLVICDARIAEKEEKKEKMKSALQN